MALTKLFQFDAFLYHDLESAKITADSMLRQMVDINAGFEWSTVPRIMLGSDGICWRGTYYAKGLNFEVSIMERTVQ